jgi:hypothetical protein
VRLLVRVVCGRPWVGREETDKDEDNGPNPEVRTKMGKHFLVLPLLI